MKTRIALTSSRIFGVKLTPGATKPATWGKPYRGSRLLAVATVRAHRKEQQNKMNSCNNDLRTPAGILVMVSDGIPLQASRVEPSTHCAAK
jgi:hypothetical protein